LSRHHFPATAFWLICSCLHSDWYVAAVFFVSLHIIDFSCHYSLLPSSCHYSLLHAMVFWLDLIFTPWCRWTILIGWLLHLFCCVLWWVMYRH
jgi:fucose 4-O-acetylase-like acetyltransferase